jgi:RecB family exonuclease
LADQAEATASIPELALALVREWPSGARRPAGFRAWETVRRAAIVEAQRRSFASAGTFEGQLPAGGAVSLSEPDVRWSATRLDSFTTCAFQFFATYGLRLEELDQELQQADPAILGTVVHEILEVAVRPLVEAGQSLSAATLPQVLGRIREIGTDLWDSAPRRHGFGRAGLWHLRWPKVSSRLERMLTEETVAAEQLGIMRIAGTEYRLDTVLDIPDGLLAFGGSIDRVDVAGSLAVIVDYKTGRAIPKSELDDAQRLQLQLYASAYQAQNPEVERVVARFAYLPPVPERNRAVLDTATDEGSQLVAKAGRRAAEIRSRIQQGRFEVMPGPFRGEPARRSCPSYCPFRFACRVTQFSRWKQWN